MSSPIIIVSGKAGSGKDTAAAHIAETYNGVTLALADPMKRFAKNLMGFTSEALWGPSAERNKVVPAAELKTYWADSWDFDTQLRLFITDVFGGPNAVDIRPLQAWYDKYVKEPLLRDGGISARTVLQTLGTEWGRQQSPSMWIDCALRRCRDLIEGGYGYDREKGMYRETRDFDYAIITDGRFRNEILGVGFQGGVTLRIVRPGEAELKAGVAGHRSEKELDGIPDHFYTDTIMNDSTIEDLHSRLDDAMAVFYGDVRG